MLHAKRGGRVLVNNPFCAQRQTLAAVCRSRMSSPWAHLNYKSILSEVALEQEAGTVHQRLERPVQVTLAVVGAISQHCAAINDCPCNLCYGPAHWEDELEVVCNPGATCQADIVRTSQMLSLSEQIRTAGGLHAMSLRRSEQISLLRPGQVNGHHLPASQSAYQQRCLCYTGHLRARGRCAGNAEAATLA